MTTIFSRTFLLVALLAFTAQGRVCAQKIGDEFVSGVGASHELRYRIIDTASATDEGGVSVMGLADGDSRGSGDLIIPSAVMHGGMSYEVDSIGEMAFAECDEFTGTLTLPNSLEGFGEDAFYKCSGFTGDLKIPDGVEEIPFATFYYCSGFDGELKLPAGLKIIGEHAFDKCSGFSGTLIIPDGVELIDDDAFDGCRGFTGDLVIPGSVKTIGDESFSGCIRLNGVLTISEGVETIDDLAFLRCASLIGPLTIPSSVKSIGYGAFNGCNRISGTLTISDGVERIGDAAFFACYSFTGSLTIPPSVKYLGNSAFTICSGFDGTLTIPDGIDEIREQTFEGCTGFTKIVIMNEVPPVIKGTAFDEVPRNIPVAVPSEDAIDAYRLAKVWMEFDKYVVMTPTGISSSEKVVKLTIAPNPASDYFEVFGVDVARVLVYNLAGALQMSVGMGQRVDVSSLATGQYIAVIVDRDGRQHSKRFAVR